MYLLNSVVLVIFATYLNVVNSLISEGNCLLPPIISDFSPANYSGTWYEMTRLPALNEQDLKCVRIQYGTLNGTTLSVHNGGINLRNNVTLATDGFAVSENPQKPNVLSVFFPDITGDAPQPYDVWMTDYNSFACVYSCKQIIPNVLKYETMWVLSRQTKIDQGLLQKLISFFKSRNAPVDKILNTDQTDCTYI